MEQHSIDQGAAAAIDTLMARIRKTVEKRSAATPSPAAPPFTNGTNGAFQAQADFNLALVESLDSIAAYLQGGDKMAALEERIQQGADHTHQVGDLTNRLSSLLQDVDARANGATARSAELERKMSQDLQALDGVWQERFAAMQQRLDLEAERHAHAVQEMAAQIKDLRALLGEEHNRVDVLVQKVDAVSAQTAQLTQHVNDLSQLEATVKQCDQACKTSLADAVQCQQRTSHELEELRIRILRSERKARALTPGGKLRAESPPAAAPAVESAAPAPPSRPPIDYFLFEHRFRGSRADIKQRQRIYLDLFHDKQAVLDVGCGRGEFIELLREHGVPVTGIDFNEDMAEFCKDLSLPVIQADAFAHLEGLADASLDGVFSAQVVEHLTTEQLVAFLGLCAAKLRPEGVLVLETINPNCPPAMNWFYLDPTHVRPVPGDLLRFLLEQDLFAVRMLKFSSPLPGVPVPAVLDAPAGLPAEAGIYQDYAAVAYKR